MFAKGADPTKQHRGQRRLSATPGYRVMRANTDDPATAVGESSEWLAGAICTKFADLDAISDRKHLERCQHQPSIGAISTLNFQP
jgi:hypothetical protein